VTASPAPLRVLLIDDSPQERFLARRELQSAFKEVEIVEVSDGAGFDRHLAAGEFDVVIVDYQLRWSTGRDVLEIVKSADPYRPVVMYTATATQEIAVEAMKAGLDDYVVKAPQHIVRLSAAVRAAVARAAGRRTADGERAAMLERERALRAEAESANRTKDEFLATVSHELRTPLTSVLGWARMLLSDQLNGPTRRKAVEAIVRNAEAQVRLVSDLLDMSNIERGKLRLDVRRIDVNDTVREAIETVRTAADARRVRLEVSFPSGPSLVSGDAVRLQQIVWNLLSNAVKFTDGGGSVRVTVERNTEAVILRVTDTGRGIEPAFLARLFERFTQADGSITRRHGGVGLGLAIVRHLVELHGGTVTADSDGVGRGATFVVQLPRVSRSGVSQDAPPEVQAARPEPSISGVTVLVVEDDADGRALMETMLRLRGAAVTAVDSVRAAETALEVARPDVVVSDIAMPDEDGYALLAALERTRPPGVHIPTIAVTALARHDDRQRALRAGYDVCLTKPLAAEELVRAVHGLATRRLNAPRGR
jgi:signal transduction histidine kinase